MMVSVDGYFEGPNHDISWHNVGAEFNEFAIEQTKSVGTLLFGRRTYELMSAYWPTEQARKGDPLVAELMNTTPKIVFSRTMGTVADIPHWEHVTLKNEVVPAEIEALKSNSAKDIGIFGSNNLCVSLMRLGLVDEFRVMVNPVAIGQGAPLFFGLDRRENLKLVGSRTFASGNILHTYEPRDPRGA